MKSGPLLPPDRHEPRVITWVRNPKVRRTLILGSLWVFLGAVLIAYRDVLLPFGLALLLAFILEPAVAGLTKRRLRGRPVSRPLALLLIYGVALTVAVLFSVWAFAQIGVELAGLGRITRTLVHELRIGVGRVLDWSEAFAVKNAIPLDRAEMEAALQHNLVSAVEEVSRSTAELLTLGREVIGSTFEAVFGAFLVMMLTAFMSSDRFRIEAFFGSLVPPEQREDYGTILSGISTGLSGVVRGQVLICLTNGVLTFIGLWLFNVKLPLLLALVATLFSLIPIFGSIISTIPIVAMALVDGFSKAIFALLWIIGIHLLEGNVLNPKIMGGAAKIHPVVVIFALIVGERSGGLIGALFAVPIAAVIQTIFLFLRGRALRPFDEDDAFNTVDLAVLPPDRRPIAAPGSEAAKPTEPSGSTS